MNDDDEIQELMESMKRHPSAHNRSKEIEPDDIEYSILRAINLYRKVSK